MKVLKAALGLAGIIGLIVAGVFLFLTYVDTRSLLAAANADKSGNLFPDPMARIYLTAVIGAVGGLLLGLAMGLPPRTAGAIERDTLDAVNQARSEEIARKALYGQPADGNGGGDGQPGHPDTGPPPATPPPTAPPPEGRA